MSLTASAGLLTMARARWYAGAALTLASACGGQSFKGNGGEAGDSGSSSGASSSFGGSSSSGGKARGGTSAGGSSTTGNGAGGSQAFTGACAGPSEVTDPKTGGCAAYFRRWTHDITTGLCMPVAYGGCGATSNNYETLEACQKACPGGSPNYDACKVPTDCAVTANSCCGVCDGANLSKHDFIAYNKANAAKVRPCGNDDVACNSCPNGEPGNTTATFFVPNCVAGECVVEDIRESDVTACTSAKDCELRSGTHCCQSCVAGNVVSVRNDGSFEELVCGDAPVACPQCLPAIGSDAQPTCDQGRCGVVFLLK